MRTLHNRSGRTAAAVVIAATTFADCPSAQEAAQTQLTSPVVALEKTRFTTNERVFFWIGVDSTVVIPKSFYESCELTLVRPDGTKRSDEIRGPVDGSGRGWRGGYSLGSETPQVGRYRVVFECGGLAPAIGSFVVEDLPVLNQIVGDFIYSSPLLLDSPEATATLLVRNGSNEVIRFPHRGVALQHVWMKLDKVTGDKWISSFPLSETLLVKAAGIRPSALAPDSFTWKLVDQVPTVTLEPGESFELRLSVADVISERAWHLPPGDYTVTMSTTLQVLIGSPDGASAYPSPLRIDVSSTARGTFGAR